MDSMNGLKEKITEVLYKNLTQWKLKLATPSAPELKTFIVQELARMETELIAYNQLILQREWKNRQNSSKSPPTTSPPTAKEKEQAQWIATLFQNNLQLLALVQILLSKESPHESLSPEASPIAMNIIGELGEITEKGVPP